jgi:hypothetical protein
VLIRKIDASDGVVSASPNYSFQVSGLMKTFLDGLGFLFHRPRFFGKAFTSIVSQGIYGGGKIVSYFDFAGSGLGFNTVKGSCLGTLEPLTEKAKRAIDRTLAGQSRRFYDRLLASSLPVPSLFRLMTFRLSRTNIELVLDAGDRDHACCSERGWFESDYYYPTRLGALRRAAGRFFDSVAGSIARTG